MSTVTIILLTYAPSVDHPRAGYARTTLSRTLENLCGGTSRTLHIADDGSDPLHIASLVEIARSYEVEPSITNAERGGYGKSYNLATQRCHIDSEYFLVLEDDWELTRPLNLDPLINAMTGTGIGCIRLGYLGWTQELTGYLRHIDGYSYLQFFPDSPERHVWAGHPRLESKAFQKRVGPWPEGYDPGTTEFMVAGWSEARQGVAWPLDLGVNASQQNASLYAHVGAIQARTDQ